MWISAPIKLFNFQEVGTIAKKGDFNIVINIDEYKNIFDTTFRKAIYINTNKSGLLFLNGNQNLKIPTQNKDDTGYNLSGFYSFKCSKNSIICAKAEISLTKVFLLETKLLIGIISLSILSALLVGVYLNHMLIKVTTIKNRFLRNLNEDKIICNYQPVIDFSTCKAVGCEVLVRWEDEDGSIVFPDRFLNIVKDENKTAVLTSIIVKKAFKELSDIIREHKDFKIAFNFFPTDFDYDFIQKLLRHYKELYPELNINIELTEDELIEAPAISKHINKLRSQGYLVSIDDFGTGYSSLSYLQEIAVDYIKIDRSFVKDLEIGTVKSQLIPHIVSIANTINAGIIVEGVENEDQAIYMQELGIRLVQGYYYSRPLPIDAFTEFIKSN